MYIYINIYYIYCIYLRNDVIQFVQSINPKKIMLAAWLFVHMLTLLYIDMILIYLD